MINDVHFADFYKSSADRQITITYSGGTIRNADIVGTDGFKLTERICSGKQLRFGSVGSSELKLKIKNNTVSSFVNEVLSPSIVTNGNTAYPFNFCDYKVVTDTPDRENYCRTLTAYDALYDVLNSDYSAWYNAQTFPMTLLQFRDNFFAQVGITQETVLLPNDNMLVEKTITPTTLSGKDIIFAINEVNGRFGCIGRDGKYRYVKLEMIVEGLYPADDLYPEDTLYPSDETGTPIEGAHVIKADYESTYADTISKLTIRNDDDSVGATIGSGANEYIVQNNFLLYGMSTADLTTIGTALYNEIALAYYQPAVVKVAGNPCFELGDSYVARCRTEVVRSYILERVLTGVQGMTDVYTANGESALDNNSNSIQSQVQRLNGKTHELIVSEERFYSAIYDQNGNSKIDQNSSAISLEVTNRQNAVAGVKLTADTVYAAVFNDQNQSRITINANAISQEVSDRQGAVSAVWTTVNGIDAHYISDEGNYNGVTINSSGIQCSGDGAFTVNMTNLVIDSNGNVSMEGEVTATSGKVAGFDIGTNQLSYNTRNIIKYEYSGGIEEVDVGDVWYDWVKIKSGTELDLVAPTVTTDDDLLVGGNLSVTGSFSPSSISSASGSFTSLSVGNTALDGCFWDTITIEESGTPVSYTVLCKL